MVKIEPKYLTLKQAAQYMGWSVSYLAQNWTKLRTEYGVSVKRRFGNGAYMFDFDDLKRALEKMEVIR